MFSVRFVTLLMKLGGWTGIQWFAVRCVTLLMKWWVLCCVGQAASVCAARSVTLLMKWWV